MRLVLALLLLAFAAPAAAEPTDPMVEGFRAQVLAEAQAAGLDYSKCTVTVHDKEEGGPGRVVRLACPGKPVECYFQVDPGGSPYGTEVNILGCEPVLKPGQKEI